MGSPWLETPEHRSDFQLQIELIELTSQTKDLFGHLASSGNRKRWFYHLENLKVLDNCEDSQFEQCQVRIAIISSIFALLCNIILKNSGCLRIVSVQPI